MHDSSLDITVILDVDTKIPHIIRTTEEHEVYGPSTSDLYLSDYKAVDGIMFPHTVQTIYNATTQHLNAVLEDFIIEDVTVNPEFPQDFFAGLHANESWTPKEPPSKEPGVSHARISEFTSNMLSSGYSDLTAEDLRAETLDSIPSVHWLVLDDAELGVKQMVIEFGDEVILGDAPPQYVDAVIDWVRININKPITHLWVSITTPIRKDENMHSDSNLFHASRRTITVTIAAVLDDSWTLAQSSSSRRWQSRTGLTLPTLS